MIINIMVMLHVCAGVGDDHRSDLVLYNMTGETVQQRVEAACRHSEEDPEALQGGYRKSPL